ncbi:apelin receptor B-like [Polyodon spathula]|uniref:apelin receptor B-like n=1 Tax=Polyodon spathula TaxID=7913 RepID=UPI001B7E0B1D|nr:apelin receptor B-like [Polyodon spathula]
MPRPSNHSAWLPQGAGHANHTPQLPAPSDCDYTDWAASLAIIPSIYLLAFVVGSLGNGLVLRVYLPWRSERGGPRENLPHRGGPGGRSRGLTNTFIASLALADLSFVFTLPLWAAYTALGYHWPFGAPLCKLSSYLAVVNMYASVFSLTGLSVERYLAVVRSLSAGAGPRGGPRGSWIRLAPVLCVWALAGVLGLPALVFRTVRSHSFEDYDEEWEGEPGSWTACEMDYSLSSSEASWNAALGLTSTALGFVLPLVVMLLCYCSVGLAVSRHFGRWGAGGKTANGTGSSSRNRRQQRRLLTIIATLVAAFALCWLPYHLNKTLSILTELEALPYACAFDRFLLLAHPYATCLAYISSCLNPLLYAYLDPAFRRSCAALIGCCRPGPAFKAKIAAVRRGGGGGGVEPSSASEERRDCQETELPPPSPPVTVCQV